MEAYKHYLKSNRFKVFTDHKALQWLNNIKDPTGRLGRWVLRMQEFDFEIIHREGKKKQNADAISRFPYVDEQTPSPSPALVSALDVDIAPDSLEPLLECDLLAEVANYAVDAGKDGGTFLELNLEYAQAPHIAPIDQDDLTLSPDISQLQQQCDNFKHVYRFFQDQTLPKDDKQAWFIVCESNQYVLSDGTLYHMFQPRVRNKEQQNLDNMGIMTVLRVVDI